MADPIRLGSLINAGPCANAVRHGNIFAVTNCMNINVTIRPSHTNPPFPVVFIQNEATTFGLHENGEQIVTELANKTTSKIIYI